MNRSTHSPNETSRPEDPLLSSAFRSSHFTPRQLRLLRKEVLSLRAAVERAEITQASQELRGKLSRFSWVKWLLPRWPGSAGNLGQFSALFKRYPLLSSLASIALSGPIRHAAWRVARPAAKITLVALTGWSLWQIWRTVQRPSPEGDARDDVVID
jgi:Protein of unknown function (DUF3318)